MSKVNLRITLEIHAEGESYINPNTEEELQEALEGMLSEVIGDESIKYQATMENLDNSIKVCMENAMDLIPIENVLADMESDCGIVAEAAKDYLDINRDEYRRAENG